jgi:hypothetical protein
MNGSLVRPLHHCLAGFVFCLICLAAAYAQAGDKWEKIDREDGISVFQRWPDGQELPTVRGVGTIDANIYQVLAVLTDVDHMCKWLHSCEEAKLLKTHGDLDMVTYNRFDMPWPLDDRDAVMRSTVTFYPEKDQVVLRYRNVSSPRVAKRDDVVRLPLMKGFYLLKRVGPNKTRVVFQGDASPGGMVPDMIVAQSSRSIPLEAIRKLERRVYKTRGNYADVIEGELMQLAGDL